MKKILIFFATALMMMVAFDVEAQSAGADNEEYLLCKHCQQVAMDRYRMNELGNMPPYKVAYWCSFSKETFFEADEVPEGASVYDLTEVVGYRNNEHFPADYVVNLDSMNYFGYNFDEFQKIQINWDKTIYFRTPASQHPYLGVKSYSEAFNNINTDALKPYVELTSDYFTTQK